jgi:CrcB protein
MAAVLVGGLLGSGMRASVVAMMPATANGFPPATLMVNLAGSLMLGAYLARRERAVVARWSLHFRAIGALGSFATFPAFGLEVFRLLDIGRVAVAAG